MRVVSRRHATALVVIMSAGTWVAAATAGESVRDRGAYLVNVLAACANCHTPRAANAFGPTLSGGLRFGGQSSLVFAPNITPDRLTGIGNWTDRQIIDAIKQGVRPDGTRIGPPMPQTAYRTMSETDAQAIVAYLRSVPAVAHAVQRPARDASAPITSIPSTPDLSKRPDGPVAQGRYIATSLSHCTECHTPAPHSVPDLANHLDEGGRLFHTPEGTIIAPGIRAVDLKRFSDDAIKAIITRGLLPNGRKLAGPMPVKAYSGLRPADLDALLAFLRSDQT